MIVNIRVKQTKNGFEEVYVALSVLKQLVKNMKLLFLCVIHHTNLPKLHTRSIYIHEFSTLQNLHMKNEKEM
jgi:hypothetical protein